MASIFAGTFPGCVHRLVMIEAIGPWTGPEDNMPSDLREAILVMYRRNKARRPPRLYATHELAAERRSSGNTIGILPVAAAKTLCTRGLRLLRDTEHVNQKVFKMVVAIARTRDVPRGELMGDEPACVVNGAPTKGWVWSSDPSLMSPSRMRLSDAQATAFLRRLRCRSLVITAHDGIMRRASNTLGRGVLSPWGLPVGVFMFVLLWLLRSILLFRRTLLWLWPAAPFFSTHKVFKYWANGVDGLREGLALRARLTCIQSVVSLTHVHMGGGGHHPQLTRPAEVAAAILEFLQQS